MALQSKLGVLQVPTGFQGAHSGQCISCLAIPSTHRAVDQSPLLISTLVSPCLLPPCHLFDCHLRQCHTMQIRQYIVYFNFWQYKLECVREHIEIGTRLKVEQPLQHLPWPSYQALTSRQPQHFHSSKRTEHWLQWHYRKPHQKYCSVCQNSAC